MKIEIEIPEWAEGRHIYVFAGREVIARRLWDHAKNEPGPVEIKTVRCNLCGECCFNVGSEWPFGRDDEGKCAALKEETIRHSDGRVESGFFCGAPGDIVPFTCCKGRHEDPEICCVRFE